MMLLLRVTSGSFADEGRRESLNTLIGTLRMVIEYSKGKILEKFFDFNLKLSVGRSPQFPDYSIQYV